MEAKKYNYIFLGVGCATFSIIMRMIDGGLISGKKILLIDKSLKNENDRTWCFWETKPGFFEQLVYKRWEKLFFTTEAESIPLEIAPYKYKMIRGLDFYNFCNEKISNHPNISFLQAEIEFNKDGQEILVNNSLLKYGRDTVIFNSIISKTGQKRKGYLLLQHFKGYIIETPNDIFDDTSATLMDFSVSQEHGTTFFYVLPLTNRSALVEYTLFTENLLPRDEYDKALKNYLRNIPELNSYQVVHTEFGIIPMTNASFPAKTGSLYNIGAASGQTKPSTGYTFTFIQKQADRIVAAMNSKTSLNKAYHRSEKFHFYDSTLLRILSGRKLEGKDIFSRLFRKNKAASVFKFLDNETTLPEELGLLKSLPTGPFLKAGISEAANLLRAKLFL